MAHDRIVNQHQPGLALYPRNLSYDLLPLIGPAGWALLRALHDHSDEQAVNYRGTRPIAPSSEEMQALAGVGEASLLVIKELLHLCGCLSWEEIRGKQEPRPGRQLKQPPTRSLVYYLHPLTGLIITIPLVQRVIRFAQRSERAQAYLKANGLFRSQPAFLPTSVWPLLLPQLLELSDWQALFQQIHGPVKHTQYRDAVIGWLSGAAQIVATLELEQQGAITPATNHVRDHALMVMARWQPSKTLPSPGPHGVLEESHGDSRSDPHTPINELINQSSNELTYLRQPRIGAIAGEGEDGSKGHTGQQGTGNKVKGRPRRARRADAGVQIGLQAEAVDQQPYVAVHHLSQPAGLIPQGLTNEQNHVLADAGPHALAQAEAALWAVLPEILQCAGTDPSLQIASSLPYSPTASEQRQARRLLRSYTQAAIVTALRAALGSYQPGPSQPAKITRFGFAAGLAVFRAALAQSVVIPTTTHHDSQEVAEAVVVHEQSQASLDTAMADFWHEYQRVTDRQPTRAERCRIEVVAKAVEAHNLLIWLDRWERAHSGTATALTAGYFETCAAGAALPRALSLAHARGTAAEPASPTATSSSLSLEQRRVYDRLVELGIKKAWDLAVAPGTTYELVAAWSLAAVNPSIKNRSAYIAAGITSGQPPRPRLSSRKGTSISPLASDEVDIMKKEYGEPTIAISPVWMACLTRLKAEVSLNDFETWLHPCTLIELDERVIVVAAPNIFVRQELEQRYRGAVQRVIADITGQQLEPLFVIAPNCS